MHFLLRYFALSGIHYNKLCVLLLITVSEGAAEKDKEVFSSNYFKFCNSMTDIENLLKYFITATIINTDDQSEILAPPKLTSKVTLLLKHISGPLEAGDTKPFRMMLDIMEKHGNLATKTLAISVKKCLLTNTKGTVMLSGLTNKTDYRDSRPAVS